jgi:hypothetical protein
MLYNLAFGGSKFGEKSMASGIYKHTMHRTAAGKPEDEDDGMDASAPPPASPADEDSSDSGGKRVSSAAQPVLGQRTLYVDRQVARRSRSRSKTKKIRQLQLLITLLIFGLIFVSVGWILAGAELENEVARRVELDAEVRKTAQTLKETQTRLEQRERDLSDLAENRIPGLEPIVYNEILDIEDKYVNNVTFSESGVGETKEIEYHAMLVNNGTEMVLPDVKIFMFNEFGRQVGVAVLEKEHATSNASLAELLPGETRSYHANIETERDAVPKFYRIQVR